MSCFRIFRDRKFSFWTPFVRSREKRLCHKSKACCIKQSVAILALNDQPFAYKTAHRDCVRTGTKNTIMVIIGLARRQDPADQDMNDNEKPDWNEPGHQGEDDWQLASYEDTDLRLRDNLKV